MTTTIPEAPAKPLTTAGQTQLLIDCPRCGGIHRHLDEGPRRGPCGARYTVTIEPKGPRS